MGLEASSECRKTLNPKYDVIIGFYGNANNYPYMLAAALKRLGHDVRFIVGSRDPLNRPEYWDETLSVPYPKWILDRSSSFRWHLLVPGFGRNRICELLNQCDVAILNEEGPAFAENLTVPYFVLLTGSNIEIFADPERARSLVPFVDIIPRFLRPFIPISFLIGLIRRWLTAPQRKGIQRSIFVTYFPRGLCTNGDRLLDELGISEKRRIFLLMADTEINSAFPAPENVRIRVFSLARFTWIYEPDSDLTTLDYKGSDRMIYGIALFVNKHKILLDIRFVRKGRHVSQAETLVRELGLSAHVTWLEEMTQTQVRMEYRAADIIFDQLGDSIVAMGGFEAMATGRPLIANSRSEFLSEFITDPSPICQARSAEEVCCQLERLVFSKEERVRVGQSSRKYVKTFLSSEVAAKRCLEVFDQIRRGGPAGIESYE